MATNQDVELELAQRVPEILRKSGISSKGYQCEAHLYHGGKRGDRKKHRDVEFERNWDPDADYICIWLWPVEEGEEIEPAIAKAATSSNIAPKDEPLSDLVRALDRAERRPGYEFVSLKWFRDTALTHEGFSWAADEFARHDALREAIDKRWILTSKIANPRPPHFPVTSIRLNHQMPEVNAVLGSRTASPTIFRPIPIRGEALSATVLNDRR
jgi:hypothetical protein